ncbi:hypothetical protein N7474_000770 [Penicillium riverlandense]|uniref:uncharacterized protein n=1 Tax=Penicillium riverlandense TaxID=1903569 RepID=UPI002546E2A0|nr:uncharacterized protein N7474_000770 [Penicillium riverlandense]KAJ5832459.1 hypothetical protein N7474_000770 [Penicillium riverlandense]
MAKNRPLSQHSRAARRAASPSLDVDKSLRTLPRAESPTVQRPSVLSERANSGVQKRQKKGKNISKAQRLRQQKGMERAEAVVDQMEVKLAKSVNRQKTINSRRADWEDTNRKSAMFLALQQQEDEADNNEQGDNAMAEDTAPSESKPVLKSTHTVSNPVPETPALVDEDDEIT